mgnify:CR=1 FL=1
MDSSSNHKAMVNSAGMPLEEFCGLLKLTSNPNRMRILLHLREGEFAVSDIESSLELKQPNLSHELRKLRDHGLVACRRQSKVVFYSLAGPFTACLLDGIRRLQEDLLTASRPPEALGTVNGNTGADARDRGECGHFSVVHNTHSTSKPDSLT